MFQQGTRVGISFSGRQGRRQAGPTRRPHPCMALQPVTRLQWLPQLQCTVRIKGCKSDQKGAAVRPPPFGPRLGASATWEAALALADGICQDATCTDFKGDTA